MNAVPVDKSVGCTPQTYFMYLRGYLSHKVYSVIVEVKYIPEADMVL